MNLWFLFFAVVGAENDQHLKPAPVDRVAVFNQWYKEYGRMISSEPAGCPSGGLTFEVDHEIRRISDELAEGAGLVATVSRTTDRTLAVKVGRPTVDPDEIFCIIDMQSRDRAALAALSGLGASPRVYVPQGFHPPVSTQCFLSMIVMDWKQGGVDLATLRGISQKDILEIARSATRRLKQIHDAGILHGDVHWRNIMVEVDHEGQVVPNSVWFIDFGRATPFRDATSGRRLRPAQMRAVRYPPMERLMEETALSINELRHSPMTPNDDLFRLAEALVYVALGRKDYLGLMKSSRLSAVDFKLAFFCRSHAKIPPEICDLYESTRRAKFHDAPIYAPFL